MNIQGYPIEICSIETAYCADPGLTDGDPLCLFAFRPTPNNGLRPWVLMLTPEQCVRIRDTLDKLLNDPESVIFMPQEHQEEMHVAQDDLG